MYDIVVPKTRRSIASLSRQQTASREGPLPYMTAHESMEIHAVDTSVGSRHIELYAENFTHILALSLSHILPLRFSRKSLVVPHVRSLRYFIIAIIMQSSRRAALG